MSGISKTGALLLGLVLAAPTANAAASPPPDASARHLFYLHGRIVQEEQSASPVHPRFGAYELDAIRKAFGDRGFVVHSEIRPRGESVERSAEKLAAEIETLLGSGVPADRIGVVGASMGAGIAYHAAARLQRPELRFATLGACLSENVRALAAERKPPAGRFLAIRESSDESTSGCVVWDRAKDPAPGLEARELVVDTGLSHGFLYRPLPEWLEPVVAWLQMEVRASAESASLPDPLAAGWRSAPVCERLHEDDRQRVLRCTFPPGIGHERHVHAPHFGYALSGGRVRIVDDSGSREIDLATGSSFTSAGGHWHEVVNVGDTTVAYLIVEPKP